MIATMKWMLIDVCYADDDNDSHDYKLLHWHTFRCTSFKLRFYFFGGTTWVNNPYHVKGVTSTTTLPNTT